MGRCEPTDELKDECVNGISSGIEKQLSGIYPSLHPFRNPNDCLRRCRNGLSVNLSLEVKEIVRRLSPHEMAGKVQYLINPQVH